MVVALNLLRRLRVLSQKRLRRLRPRLRSLVARGVVGLSAKRPKVEEGRLGLLHQSVTVIDREIDHEPRRRRGIDREIHPDPCSLPLTSLASANKSSQNTTVVHQFKIVMFESATSVSLPLGHPPELDSWNGKMSLRTTCTTVADRQRCCGWEIPQIGKAVAEFREGRCGFCRGGCTFGNVADGLKESATTTPVRPIEKHACSGGTCYHVLRYAAQRRTLNPPATLPEDLWSAAGRRTLHFE